MINKGGVFFIILLLGMLLLACNSQKSPRQLAEFYCGSCHKKPEPGHLSKSIWRNKVLPEMGARLGIRSPNFSYPKYLSLEGKMKVIKRNVYPLEPMLDSTKWLKIVRYFVDNAPDTTVLDLDRRKRNEPLKSFSRYDFQIDSRNGSLITGVEYDSVRKELWIGTGDNKVDTWQWGEGITNEYDVPSPVVDFNFLGNATYFTCIGIIHPNERRTGRLLKLINDSTQIICDSLKRPVHNDFIDLNGDGVQEIISCNYGHYFGSLSLLNSGKLKSEKTLLQQPGAIKSIVADLNNDGKKDIAAVFGQGNESVYFFYQEDDLTFTAHKVISFYPEYGTSDFALLDYDHDGDMDVVTVNGDNGDFSFSVKPYHGLRIFINQGDNQFEEKYFYPMYGATRLLVHDFDMDGDMDFAVSCFFAEFEELNEESFVYLENKNSADFEFKPYVLEDAPTARWMVSDKGDVDDDGDMDIILGSLTYAPDNIYMQAKDKWENSKVDVSILINHHISSDTPETTNEFEVQSPLSYKK